MTEHDFKHFAVKTGFRHAISTPHHQNRLVKNCVKIINHLLKMLQALMHTFTIIQHRKAPRKLKSSPTAVFI